METDDRKQRVLVVDDIPDNIEVLRNILREHYVVMAAINGEKALRIAFSTPKPDIILLDVMMPEIDGYEVCRRLKSDPRTAMIPIMFISAGTELENEEKGLTIGAVDYIAKPVIPSIVLARVRTHLALYDQNRVLENIVRERTEQLRLTQLEIIRRLGRASEFKDNETGLHVIRMSHYCRFIAEAYGMSEYWSDILFYAAPMHDVGKIGIPDKILRKNGKLDEKEWDIMKKHAEFGALIIGDHNSDLMSMAREIALNHHEKWDGSGYPNNLEGYKIPLCARIVSIADVFDALTSERPYKKAWPVEQAVKYINSNAGKHFDPELVPLFNNVLDDIMKTMKTYAESPGSGLAGYNYFEQ